MSCTFRALILFLLVAVTGAQAPVPGHDLRPTVILISLDGFRWDYMDKAATPNLHFLASGGVRARRMLPVFPSKTFPNHYSLVTGLHPEHHGIVDNSMYDPVFDARFSLRDREAVSAGRWWEGEPLWVTAERQGQISATYFWPGSEAEIQGIRPRFWKPYDGRVPNVERVRQLLAWLDLPAAQRPTLLTLYFSDTDDQGHRHGPDSPEIVQAIAHLDTVIGELLQGLRARDVLDRVNLIVVSDHGMCATSPSRVIRLADYVDPNAVEMIGSSPVIGLRPLTIEPDSLQRRLAHAHPHLQVYRRQDVPARFRYREHRRIMPVICLADAGWTIATRSGYANRAGEGGAHGYDNLLPDMGAFFVAHGPAFKPGLVVAPFQNIHLYPLMAHLLQLRPAPNDGSLDSVRVMLR